jgi:hypothetical protein
LRSCEFHHWHLIINQKTPKAATARAEQQQARAKTHSRQYQANSEFHLSVLLALFFSGFPQQILEVDRIPRLSDRG